MSSKVNAIYPDFVKKLDLQIHKTNVSAQKINSSKLDIFDMVIAFFSMEDKKRRFYFFEETFLLVDISLDIALGISFFTLSNVKIDFVGRYIYLRIYIIAKILLTMKQVELIRKRKFVVIALDLENKVFVIYVSSINQDLNIYPS